jgi:hypothetical protein
MPLNRQIRVFEEGKIFDFMGIFQVNQDGHAFSRARVEYGLQQAGKAEWRKSFGYRQLCLGSHCPEFRSGTEVSQRKYVVYTLLRQLQTSGPENTSLRSPLDSKSRLELV